MLKDLDKLKIDNSEARRDINFGDTPNKVEGVEIESLLLLNKSSQEASKQVPQIVAKKLPQNNAGPVLFRANRALSPSTPRPQAIKAKREAGEISASEEIFKEGVEAIRSEIVPSERAFKRVRSELKTSDKILKEIGADESRGF
jgi:hypothetical protein